ncbi:MFS hexose transporter [Pyricularia oryzae 70-15]|uniref:MFS hexose transporter n=1 Tax=Pyricularia oryzae (strain 70-15 / ATCC MYA-4617 / FGSC 8958) TaxID=242507 RepID=G4N2R1_PYRO7|nr:MFS hexose transporter [Pyricularia oryzae 70-15]EHA52566.1 MFS hexose transporter [Pyricularia oryzae 70-15]
MDKPLPTERPAQTVTEILETQSKNSSHGRFGLTPSLIKLYLLLAPACLVICATNGYDGSVLTGLQGIERWRSQFGDPKGALLGITTAALPLGSIVSTPFSAWLSDRWGRRSSILVGSFIMIIGVILQCVSTSIGTFLGGRMIIGFGITMALTAGPILISELAHPRHRAAPACVQMFFVWFLPESPRWLVFCDRSDEAYKTLATYHGGGNWEDPLVRAEFWEMKETLMAEKATKGVGPGIFLKTPANRKRLVILITLAVFGQWSGNGLVSYYLTKIFTSIGITTQGEQTMLNGTIATVNYATALMSAVMANKFGRRQMFVGGAIAMFISFSSLTASLAVYNETGSNAASKSALGFIFIYFACYNVCLNPLIFVYPVEVLTYKQRATGLSIFLFVMKTASVFNQFVDPIGMDALGWKFYLVYCCWLLIEITVFYFLYPETKGYTLERMQEVFGDVIKYDCPEEKATIAGNLDEAAEKASMKDDSYKHVEKAG